MVSRHGKMRQNSKKRKDQRREQAKLRDDFYALLSNQEKIARLDRKLGRNLGAVRERRKLNGSRN